MMSLRAVVAEELAQLLLVPGDAVALDERDEIARRVARERGAAEVGILRQEVRRVGVQVGEVAAAAAGDADLLAERSVVLDEQHAAAALPRRAAHIMPAAPAPITTTSYDAERAAVKARSASSCAALVDASRTRSPQGSKNSLTLSNQFFARGLCAPGSCALIASNSRSSSFCRDGELDRRLDRDVAVEVAR